MGKPSQAGHPVRASRWLLSSGCLLLALLPWSAPLAQTPYNLENFPDADRKLEELKAEEAEKEPYYIWQDAEGRMHTTPYPGDNRASDSGGSDKADESSGEAQGKTPLVDRVWSQSLDLRRPSHRHSEQGHENRVQPDPQVLESMGMESTQGLLKRFSGDCCQSLKVTHGRPLVPDRGYGLRLDEDSPTHGFATGNSRYALVAMPDRPDGASPSGEEPGPIRALRLRTFVNEEAFIPTVVFLDDQGEPLRLVTDILFAYKPERWHRYGLLEAWLPMTGPEMASASHVLVLTREQDLQSQTWVDQPQRQGVTPVEHSARGELELRLIRR
ncbi:MAG: MalM family protein [Oleiphilaceae bacterium]|nr:MalM family protein [Oleiphilaceae bacterium]